MLKLNFLSLCAGFLLLSCGEVSKGKEEYKQLPRTREEIVFSYAPIVKKVAPAVVNICAIQHAKTDSPPSPLKNNPFFKQFFKPLHPKKGQEKESLGSGVIVSKEGLVLTNYHVIENADVIQVALSDKREYIAKLIAIDKRTDLALLKIEDHGNFSYLTVSLHEDLEVGDVVLAIGNPFGVGQTVTTGIVSALAHSQKGISDFRTFIQTDAAINPGNSGGALITTDGRLIGINTAIYSESGGSVGIGFAIPTTLAIPVIKSVKNGGRILRPWLGLDAESVTLAAAQALRLKHPFGVLVESVYPEGPADKAGLKRGDFIAAFNGHEIKDDTALEYQIAVSPIGEKAELTFFRQGKEREISILLDEPMGAKDPAPLAIQGPNPLHGSSISTLSPALALDMGFNPMKTGVVVTKVLKAGVAAKVGVQSGDIIESINKKSIKTKEEAAHLLKKDASFWILVLHRGDQVLTLEVNK
jgi:Do/DeqQ family serine protease